MTMLAALVLLLVDGRFGAEHFEDVEHVFMWLGPQLARQDVKLTAQVQLDVFEWRR